MIATREGIDEEEVRGYRVRALSTTGAVVPNHTCGGGGGGGRVEDILTKNDIRIKYMF